MSRLIAVLAAAVVLSACGQEADYDLPASAPAVATSANPVLQARNVEIPAATAMQSNDLVRLQRTQSDAVRPVSTTRELVALPTTPALGVDVELQQSWNAMTLTGLVAVPGCGWWPIASAHAVAANGQAAFSFEPKEQVDLSQMESTLFFFLDHDGDTVCDTSKGDEVFSASLGKVGVGNSVQVALTDLQAEPYLCSLFGYLP